MENIVTINFPESWTYRRINEWLEARGMRFATFVQWTGPVYVNLDNLLAY